MRVTAAKTRLIDTEEAGRLAGLLGRTSSRRARPSAPSSKAAARSSTSPCAGGYSPNLVRIDAGKPVRLPFDRQESSDCSARVVFPDLRTSASLAAFGTATLDLDIPEPGECSWACGMNMLHGTLIAEAPADSRAVQGAADEDRETARAVGVGPRLDAGPGRERAEFALPGALRSLPTDVAPAEADLQAIDGVESAQVTFGMERAGEPCATAAPR